MKINLAVLDDHPMLVRGVQNMLLGNDFIHITGTYTSATTLLNDLDKFLPDILLLDILMNEQNGDKLAARLKKDYPTLALIAFTNQEHQYYINTMLQLEVDGYVLKTSPEATLVEAIKKVSKGEKYYDANIQHLVKKALNPKIHHSSLSPKISERELEILYLIAQDLNSQEIAEKIFLTKKTIDFHRANLLLKLDVKTTGSLIKKAIELGLIKF